VGSGGLQSSRGIGRVRHDSIVTENKAIVQAQKIHWTFLCQKFGQVPNVVRNFCFHRRSDADRTVNPAEIVVREIQRQGRPVVLKLAAEAIRQAGEASNLHTHREVLALDMRGANTARLSGNTKLRDLYKFSGAAPSFTFTFWVRPSRLMVSSMLSPARL
jgi:hypothetical protein